MKKSVVVLTILILVLSFTIPVFAITGGQPDGNDHENVGAIVGVTSNGNFIFCSGTLIAEDVFLTAGHCTAALEYYLDAGIITLANLKVSFDTDDALNTGHLDVSDLETHPDYRPIPGAMGVGWNDVGVIMLSAPAAPTPALLPSENFLEDLRGELLLGHGKERGTFTVVGYGATLEWPPPISIPGDGIRRQAQSEFLNLRETWLHMSQNQAPGQGNSGTCWGDSGGPTFWVDEYDVETLVAVTSWGDYPCVATGTAQRIDNASSLDFLYGILGES
jgi:secreted trypsin-like serine protease